MEQDNSQLTSTKKPKVMNVDFTILMSIPEILEYGNQDKELYDIEIKCWNLKDDDIIVFIDKELQEYGENLKVTKIIAKEEHGYYCTRYYDGNDAKDKGYRYWILFDKYRKGFGKCTCYAVELKRYND